MSAALPSFLNLPLPSVPPPLSAASNAKGKAPAGPSKMFRMTMSADQWATVLKAGQAAAKSGVRDNGMRIDFDGDGKATLRLDASTSFPLGAPKKQPPKTERHEDVYRVSLPSAATFALQHHNHPRSSAPPPRLRGLFSIPKGTLAFRLGDAVVKEAKEAKEAKEVKELTREQEMGLRMREMREQEERRKKGSQIRVLEMNEDPLLRAKKRKIVGNGKVAPAPASAPVSRVASSSGTQRPKLLAPTLKQARPQSLPRPAGGTGSAPSTPLLVAQKDAKPSPPSQASSSSGSSDDGKSAATAKPATSTPVAPPELAKAVAAASADMHRSASASTSGSDVPLASSAAAMTKKPVVGVGGGGLVKSKATLAKERKEEERVAKEKMKEAKKTLGREKQEGRKGKKAGGGREGRVFKSAEEVVESDEEMEVAPAAAKGKEEKTALAPAPAQKEPVAAPTPPKRKPAVAATQEKAAPVTIKQARPIAAAPQVVIKQARPPPPPAAKKAVPPSPPASTSSGVVKAPEATKEKIAPALAKSVSAASSSATSSSLSSVAASSVSASASASSSSAPIAAMSKPASQPRKKVEKPVKPVKPLPEKKKPAASMAAKAKAPGEPKAPAEAKTGKKRASEVAAAAPPTKRYRIEWTPSDDEDEARERAKVQEQQVKKRKALDKEDGASMEKRKRAKMEEPVKMVAKPEEGAQAKKSTEAAKRVASAGADATAATTKAAASQPPSAEASQMTSAAPTDSQVSEAAAASAPPMLQLPKFKRVSASSAPSRTASPAGMKPRAPPAAVEQRPSPMPPGEWRGDARSSSRFRYEGPRGRSRSRSPPPRRSDWYDRGGDYYRPRERESDWGGSSGRRSRSRSRSPPPRHHHPYVEYHRGPPPPSRGRSRSRSPPRGARYERPERRLGDERLPPQAEAASSRPAPAQGASSASASAASQPAALTQPFSAAPKPQSTVPEIFLAKAHRVPPPQLKPLNSTSRPGSTKPDGAAVDASAAQTSPQKDWATANAVRAALLERAERRRSGVLAPPPGHVAGPSRPHASVVAV